MPRDKPIPGSAEDWLARAKGNLALASQSKLDEVFWEDLVFQAQQAAEKAMKAIYRLKGLQFRYTHDLEELGKGLEDSGLPIPLIVKEAVILTKYALQTRYPGPIEPVTEEEYQEAPSWGRCRLGGGCHKGKEQSMIDLTCCTN